MISSLSQSEPRIKEGTWADFRQDVEKVNPELFAIIEKISPGNQYKLFEATYFYGEKITDLGTICLPSKNHPTPLRLDDPRLPNAYRDQLGYCPTPLILQLTRGSEVFVDTGERIIPFNIFTPGDLYGLFETMMPLTGCPVSPCWSVTAGARSVFLAAKVTDTLGHQRLKAEYHIKLEPPKKLNEQWYVIKAIGKRACIDSPWVCKTLIFTKDWFINHTDDLSWALFHNYLFKQSWIQSKYMRSKSELSLMWEVFASTIRDKNLKPSPYILDNIMHNLFLANGAIPGFVPADTDELLLPSLAIEKAYAEVYGLKEYAPIIMCPWIIGKTKKYFMVYYSLAYPTMLEGTPAIRHAPSIISELRAIKKLMQTLEKIISRYNIVNYDLTKGVTFEYFHTEDDRFGEIKPSKNLLEDDSYIQTCMERFKGKIFPYQGPFFRGCLRVKRYP